MRPITYHRARSADDAIKAAAAADGDYIAGGTTILDLMKLDVMRPPALVDINPLANDAIEAGDDGIRFGAQVRMADAAGHPAVKRDYAVIADALRLAASPQLRNMATLGGNVLQRTRCAYFRDTGWARCNKRNPGSGCAAREGVNRMHAILGVSDACIAAYPGDFAQALIALDAGVKIAGPEGRRELAFADLHRPPGETPDVETALAPGELITELFVRAGGYTRRSLYLKIRDRESYAFALASAAVALDLDGDLVREARIALGGVATIPWRAREAEAVLNGEQLNETSATAAAEAAFANARTFEHNAYKLPLGKRTLVRALLQAGQMELEE